MTSVKSMNYVKFDVPDCSGNVAKFHRSQFSRYFIKFGIPPNKILNFLKMLNTTQFAHKYVEKNAEI